MIAVTGTGCAVPSKYRNVSGIYLQVQFHNAFNICKCKLNLMISRCTVFKLAGGAILLDTGEPMTQHAIIFCIEVSFYLLYDCLSPSTQEKGHGTS